MKITLTITTKQASAIDFTFKQDPTAVLQNLVNEAIAPWIVNMKAARDANLLTAVKNDPNLLTQAETIAGVGSEPV